MDIYSLYQTSSSGVDQFRRVGSSVYKLTSSESIKVGVSDRLVLTYSLGLPLDETTWVSWRSKHSFYLPIVTNFSDKIPPKRMSLQ